MLDLKYTNVSSYDSLDANQKQALDNYAYGMIHGALASQKRFAVFELVGGPNADWSYTPFHAIYQYHKDRGANNPVSEAGKDIGRIFKNLMIQDQHRKYKVVGKIQRRFPTNLYEYDLPEHNSWV